MMLIKIFMLFILSSHAAGSWLCREAASLRNGDVINACGVGEGSNENEARSSARNAAFEELDSVCSRTPDCANFDYVITPLRTDCEKTATGYKCYRGIEATITKVRRDPSVPRDHGKSRIIPTKMVVVQEDLLEGKIERSVISFSSSPMGALVYVDGIETCQTPCSRELQHGSHHIALEKKNYQRIEDTIIVSKETKDLHISLDTTVGYIDISDIPVEAKVRIDDVEVDVEKFKLAPGKHIVTIESAYFQPYMKEVLIKKGVTTKLHNVLEPLFGFAMISAKDKNGNALKARVYVDGKEYGGTTPLKVKIPSGTKKIEVMGINNLYGHTTKVIEPDTLYNLNFVLSNGRSEDRAPQRAEVDRRAPIMRIFDRPKECYKNMDCDSGFQCATIRGEYPGSCVKSGLGI